jgi:two-component system, NarL family, nitrate/nitrite response regulator NarL
MGNTLVAVVVEPRLLVREALIALMGSFSHQVSRGAASAAELLCSSDAANAPDLVVLGECSAGKAASEASAIRGIWPQTKILLLFEQGAPLNLEGFLASEIDGCIPLSASPDILISTLQMICIENLRILLVGRGIDHSVLRAATAREGAVRLAASRVKSVGETSSEARLELLGAETSANGSLHVAHIQHLQNLSEREEQILKGLVKGQSNKVIARACSVTEATVKVHMKSILRKIRVANRTQAAIWALEHGYCGEEERDHSARKAGVAVGQAAVG